MGKEILKKTLWPGSSTQWVTHEVGDHVWLAANDIH